MDELAKQLDRIADILTEILIDLVESETREVEDAGARP